MNKMNNPFAIRRSPVEVLAAQAVTLDDYVKLIPRGGRVNVRVKGANPTSGPIDEEPEPSPVNFCSTLF